MLLLLFQMASGRGPSSSYDDVAVAQKEEIIEILPKQHSQKGELLKALNKSIQEAYTSNTEQASDAINKDSSRFNILWIYDIKLNSLYWGAGSNWDLLRSNFVSSMIDHPIGTKLSDILTFFKEVNLVTKDDVHQVLDAKTFSFTMISHVLLNDMITQTQKALKRDLPKINATCVWREPTIICDFTVDMNRFPLKGLSYYHEGHDSGEKEPPAKRQRLNNNDTPTLEQKCITSSSRSELLKLQSQLCKLQSQVSEKLTSLDQCSICMDSTVNRMCSPCGHSFCSECIDKSRKLKDECPTCRARVNALVKPF